MTLPGIVAAYGSWGLVAMRRVEISSGGRGNVSPDDCTVQPFRTIDQNRRPGRARSSGDQTCPAGTVRISLMTEPPLGLIPIPTGDRRIWLLLFERRRYKKSDKGNHCSVKITSRTPVRQELYRAELKLVQLESASFVSVVTHSQIGVSLVRRTAGPGR